VSLFTKVVAACMHVFDVVRDFLFVYEISQEPLDGFAPNSHGRRVWFLAWTSLKVKVKGQGHQGQKRHFLASLASSVIFTYFELS